MYRGINLTMMMIAAMAIRIQYQLSRRKSRIASIGVLLSVVWLYQLIMPVITSAGSQGFPSVHVSVLAVFQPSGTFYRIVNP